MKIQPAGRDWIGIQIWDWKSKRLLWSNTGANPFTFSPDGKLLAFEDEEKNRVVIREAQTGKIHSTISLPTASQPGGVIRYDGMGFSADSRSLYCQIHRYISKPRQPGTILYSTDTLAAYDAGSGKLLKTLQQSWLSATTATELSQRPKSGRFRSVQGYSVAPDGMTLIVDLSLRQMELGGKLEVPVEDQFWVADWNGRLLRRLSKVSASSKILIAPNSRLVASWDEFEESNFSLCLGSLTTVDLWNLTTGAPGPALKAAPLLTAPVFSQDGKRIALASAIEGKPALVEISVRDTADGGVLQHFSALVVPGSSVMSLLLSGDGKTLALASSDFDDEDGNYLQLWDVK